MLGVIRFDGQFQRINPAWARTLGYTSEELLAERFVNLIHPEDRQSSLAHLERMAGGEAVASFESRLRTKDGTYRTFLWSGAPLLDQHAFSVTGHDITSQKRADEELRLRDRAMQSVSQGILITDARQPDAPIVYASPGFVQLTGYGTEEVIGQNCRFLQGMGTDRAAVGRIREAVREAKPCKEELLNYRKDGTPFWNELSLAPVKNQSGALTHFVGVQTDVTERRSLEEQFRQAQKMEAVGQLAGGVAHDFNNLLSIITGYSEIILSKAGKDDPIRAFVKEISEASARAASLTRQLLAFSRKTVLEPKVLDLNEVVRETGKMLRRLIGEDILFTNVLDPMISRVKVDPDQLGQMLMNLTVNARDAMPRGGSLTIETRPVELDQEYARLHSDVRPGKYTMLAVSDTGTGMPPDVKERIFEPFFTTKGVGTGTGLGLAVVMGIVKQSGGHVAVYSEVNRGTAFKLYFPAVEDQASRATARSDVGSVRGAETVLVVEDEDGVRTLVLLILQTHGYKVLAATDGKDALRVVERHQGAIDLLLTDVVMPGMGGREVAQTLQLRFPQMKVLYTSGYTDDAVVRHGILQEETAFLQKPYSLQSLANKVRQVLDLK
ncbi:PAS domain-containing protein [Fimbriiglobus ruber]|uniref:PAS domain-containing protein n=1 Tax=Fimbriiglobus ruber TaxID=1908690 RepID=UPI0030844FD3